MNIEPTPYYSEFLRYFRMAKKQQENCNLGNLPYSQSGVDDDLMSHVELYDVVERKYAGFSQIINDCFYGWTDKHPYWHKMQAGNVTAQRNIVAKNWTGKQAVFELKDWLYVFILHRVCGSGINYATKPSGYHNTILFDMHECNNTEDMVSVVKTYPKTFYTSVGYQFPAFPKPAAGYKRGGDYFLSEFAPVLARDLAEFLTTGKSKKDFRELGSFMLAWNVSRGLRQYKFQYAAVIADIADWFPEYVNLQSMFYYGTNAVECISYLAKPKTKMKPEAFLDAVMEMAVNDTGGHPYNLEDVACDFIRWISNYFRTGNDYNHLDANKIWNSSKLIHPFGRQKAMLDLKLIESFNTRDTSFTKDQIISLNNLTVQEYVSKVKNFTGYQDWIAP